MPCYRSSYIRWKFLWNLARIINPANHILAHTDSIKNFRRCLLCSRLVPLFFLFIYLFSIKYYEESQTRSIILSISYFVLRSFFFFFFNSRICWIFPSFPSLDPRSRRLNLKELFRVFDTTQLTTIKALDREWNARRIVGGCWSGKFSNNPMTYFPIIKCTYFPRHSFIPHFSSAGFVSWQFSNSFIDSKFLFKCVQPTFE